MHNTLGIGRELYRSVVFAYVVVIKLPLGWSIIFFKNRLYDLGWCAGIRSDREFGGYNMYGIICRRAVLEAELGYPVLPMMYPKAINCNIGRVSPVEGC